MLKTGTVTNFVQLKKPELGFYTKLVTVPVLVICFLLNSISFVPAQTLPAPGVMVHLSPEFVPSQLVGMTIHPDNALKFDFLINRGDHALSSQEKNEEYTKLIKYFLASMTIPNGDQWVNLSPYEKDRIIADNFGTTQMGRDLLAQDYILKQITSSLIYPEDGIGKKFWAKIYERAQKEYGTTNVPVNTFNKVWIIPDQAVVYEKGNTAYVLRNHLKVMLEEDYLAVAKNHSQPGDRAAKQTCYQADCQASELTNTKAPQVNHQLNSDIAKQIIKELVIPELTNEVNTGKNFANLRQIYSGMILAAWYKKALKESLLSQVYANKAKLRGLQPTRGHVPEGAVSPSGLPSKIGLNTKATQGTDDIDYIYNQYLVAFKKGVFNYIKDDIDQYTHEAIPRKYFSGGTTAFVHEAQLNPAMLTPGQVAYYRGNLPKNVSSVVNLSDFASYAQTTDKVEVRFNTVSKDVEGKGKIKNAAMMTQRFRFALSLAASLILGGFKGAAAESTNQNMSKQVVGVTNEIKYAITQQPISQAQILTNVSKLIDDAFADYTKDVYRGAVSNDIVQQMQKYFMPVVNEIVGKYGMQIPPLRERMLRGETLDFERFFSILGDWYRTKNKLLYLEYQYTRINGKMISIFGGVTGDIIEKPREFKDVSKKEVEFNGEVLNVINEKVRVVGVVPLGLSYTQQGKKYIVVFQDQHKDLAKRMWRLDQKYSTRTTDQMYKEITAEKAPQEWREMLRVILFRLRYAEDVLKAKSEEDFSNRVFGRLMVKSVVHESGHFDQVFMEHLVNPSLERRKNVEELGAYFKTFLDDRSSTLSEALSLYEFPDEHGYAARSLIDGIMQSIFYYGKSIGLPEAPGSFDAERKARLFLATYVKLNDQQAASLNAPIKELITFVLKKENPSKAMKTYWEPGNVAARYLSSASDTIYSDKHISPHSFAKVLWEASYRRGNVLAVLRGPEGGGESAKRFSGSIVGIFGVEGEQVRIFVDPGETEYEILEDLHATILPEEKTLVFKEQDWKTLLFFNGNQIKAQGEKKFGSGYISFSSILITSRDEEKLNHKEVRHLVRDLYTPCQVIDNHDGTYTVIPIRGRESQRLQEATAKAEQLRDDMQKQRVSLNAQEKEEFIELLMKLEYEDNEYEMYSISRRSYRRSQIITGERILSMQLSNSKGAAENLKGIILLRIERKKLKKEYREREERRNSDGANIVQAMMSPNTGGIDLNADRLDLQIKRDGRGIPLPLAQQDRAQLSRISGFIPQILQISPITDWPDLSVLQ